MRQNAAICSPEASLGKYFCFCASVPQRRMPWKKKPQYCNTEKWQHALVEYCSVRIKTYQEAGIQTLNQEKQTEKRTMMKEI